MVGNTKIAKSFQNKYEESKMVKKELPIKVSNVNSYNQNTITYNYGTNNYYNNNYGNSKNKEYLDHYFNEKYQKFIEFMLEIAKISPENFFVFSEKFTNESLTLGIKSGGK